MSVARAHVPVLLHEALEGLAIRADGCYLDGTFGRGGHSAAILERLGNEGRLIAIDKDKEAVRHARETLGDDARFSIEQGSFAGLTAVAEKHGVTGRVDGILLDLGVSSPQLDDPERGFSFQQEGPLDMRMDRDGGESAAEWLHRASEEEIVEVLRTYGEERFAKRIARAIVQARGETPLTSTRQLAEIVAKANPSWEKHKHPATRAFQAIRIRVNRELDDLRTALRDSLKVLAPGGRLAVISFHSLEDRMVKQFMRDESRGPQLPPGVPVRAHEVRGSVRLVSKAIKAGDAEVADNPRARSAVLRVAERLA